MELNFFDAGETLGRFNLLIRDLLDGKTKRNEFAQWELELLLDIAGCSLEPGRARTILMRYQTAATRQLAMGRVPPMKLSEYLKIQEVRDQAQA